MAVSHQACSFRRSAIFLVDHTDPESGDLHFAPNNTGASPFTEVLAALFPTTFLETMETGAQNTFTLLACGGLLKCRELVTDVKSFAQSDRGPFSWVMAFVQMDFQPSSANSFLMDIMLSWHICRLGDLVTPRFSSLIAFEGLEAVHGPSQTLGLCGNWV
ncbi:hypothetical protein L208DRAFT_1377020 [Tricholoma matsutake]|nr:hypothetical protein L208DRAFT_1377020 [Tricholoma matsutake 945]